MKPTPPDNSHDGLGKIYTFPAAAISGSSQSARVILRILFDIYRPQSVFDLGCGHGSWLAAAEELGCKRMVGVDGKWIDPTTLVSKNIEFSKVNLEEDLQMHEKFDLAISVEVAEHLSPGRARACVETLCAASDVVLFSAAIPSQGGIHHVNEQWQSYWAGLFNAAGYDCHDLIRPVIWRNQQVESWYRQNLLLYVKRSNPLTEQVRSKGLGPLDLVHPEIFEGNVEWYRKPVEAPTLRFCCECLVRWGKRQLRKLR